jgi:AsmA family protein
LEQARLPSHLSVTQFPGDPVRVGGTLMKPTITIAGIAATEKPKLSAVLSVFGKVIAGMFKAKETPMHLATIPCATLTTAALR